VWAGGKEQAKKISKNDEKGTASAGRGGSSGDERALKISAGRPRRGPQDGLVLAGKSTPMVDFQSQTSNHEGERQELAAWAEAERDLKKSLVKETTKAGLAGSLRDPERFRLTI
jgi:hypothetical protein